MMWPQGNALSARAILTHLSCGRRGCPCVTAVARARGNTHCPAHDDRSPSLSVTERSGRVLLYCHAGCSYQDVRDAIERTTPF